MPNYLYVYAILSAACPLPQSLAGLDGERIALVGSGDLAAAVSGCARLDPQPTANLLLRHEAVVEAIRARAPALPVRFGTLLPGKDAVVRALCERHEGLAADLRHLGRLVEFGLVVLWHNGARQDMDGAGGADSPSDDALQPGGCRGAGARYMMARLAEHRQADELRERADAVVGTLDATLGALAIESRHEVCSTTHLALRAAYLVEPERIAVFRQTFDEIHGGLLNARCLLTGPWPPYSFVRSGGRADGMRRDDPVLSLARRVARFL